MFILDISTNLINSKNLPVHGDFMVSLKKSRVDTEQHIKKNVKTFFDAFLYTAIFPRISKISFFNVHGKKGWRREREFKKKGTT